MPGGEAIYVGTEHGRKVVKELNARGCYAHIHTLDLAISSAGLELVTKEQARTIDEQSAYIKQLELIIDELKGDARV